jgi:hypothetical protein
MTEIPDNCNYCGNDWFNVTFRYDGDDLTSSIECSECGRGPVLRQEIDDFEDVLVSQSRALSKEELYALEQ